MVGCVLKTLDCLQGSRVQVLGSRVLECHWLKGLRVCGLLRKFTVPETEQMNKLKQTISDPDCNAIRDPRLRPVCAFDSWVAEWFLGFLSAELRDLCGISPNGHNVGSLFA